MNKGGLTPVDLSHEEQRLVLENLSEDELALFDLIIRKTPAELSDKEKNAIRKGVRELPETLKRGKFVIDWKKLNVSELLNFDV